MVHLVWSFYFILFSLLSTLRLKKTSVLDMGKIRGIDGTKWWS